MSKKESLPLKSLDPVFLHSYATKSGELICEITITPEMYNKPVDIELLSDEDMYVELQQSARILTPPSPLIIEEGVLLVDVNAIAPRTLEVTCRMEEVEVGEIDTLVFKEALIPSLAEEIRIDQTDKAFKDNNVIFRYVYRDKDDNYVCAVDITPDDYK